MRNVTLVCPIKSQGGPFRFLEAEGVDLSFFTRREQLIPKMKAVRLAASGISDPTLLNFGLLRKDETAPSTNCAGWLDTDISSTGWNAWNLDGEKQMALEIMDRLEGVASNFEERRERRNSQRLTWLLNFFTLAGVVTIYQYLYDFSSRHIDGHYHFLINDLDMLGVPLATVLLVMSLFLISRSR